MTTYPLSEPATIYSADGSNDPKPAGLGRGTLEECADIVAGLPADERSSVTIRMDDLDLAFGAQEIGELLKFLHEEPAGLSNSEITDIKTSAQ
ncbi:hypothetical protein HMP09_0092 [Sphingomonas sp. HMP9]|uniref:hypothetical protein n=1 Tax=Sphingomonas sp. HMP9 TaxID=1517554 RepID=UPI00159711AF|nr:hypothetical protein [Sphingomonas sp. HMP9]BCA60858.1 hypothetical protein HMP09_0092 [Sphingomonas sp. HMP9]